MPRIQLILSDEERELFKAQAHREGKPLDEWLKAAARRRLGWTPPATRSGRIEDLDAFFRKCDEIPGPEREPDWEDFKEAYCAYNRPSVQDAS